MQSRIFTITAIAIIATGCQPNEIDIAIPQTPKQMAVASTAITNADLFVTLGYSFNSLTDLGIDTSANADKVLSILIDSAIVTLSSTNNVDTLAMVYAGIYGNDNMHLEPGAVYTLRCADFRNNKTITASTTYFPELPITSIQPLVTRKDGDTTVNLNIEFNKIAGDNMHYYMLSYTHLNPSTTPSPVNSKSFGFLNDKEIKNVDLFTDADAKNGVIKVSPYLNSSSKDTLYAQLGQIEEGYYQYLTAYKRTGSFFNQLTGEPITLPTNIVTGYGYFCLYTAQRYVFDLNDY